MDIADWEVVLPMTRCEFLIIVYIHASEKVNQLQERSEIETGIIVQIDTIKNFVRYG